MERPLVVISGLPASGKTTLGRLLAPALKLPLLDKDDILEALFESRGTGDDAWRRALSRESDSVLQAEAAASAGAVLVSFWHQHGMADDSGTATGWLLELSTRVVNVHCSCPTELAAKRFFDRKRHAGHRDVATTFAEVLTKLRALEELDPIKSGTRIVVDASTRPEVQRLVAEIGAAFAGCMMPLRF